MPTPPLVALARKPLKAKRFAKAFIKHNGNATAAAQELRPYTYDSARDAGSKMLKKPEVIEEIRKALEELHIDYSYVMGTRKQFIDKSIDQLNGKRKLEEPFVSPADAHKHLQGIETVLMHVDEMNKKTNSNSPIQININVENMSTTELVAKRNELSGWFNGILGTNKPDVSIDSDEVKEG